MRKIHHLFLFVILHCNLLIAQPVIQPVGVLPASLNESSGLLYINQSLLTHTDSGGDPALYFIDTTTATLVRTVYIKNASNQDWEDICADASYTYIADIGNNNGSRKNLKVYRVTKHDLLDTSQDSISADTISFAYADQLSFTSSPRSTNFDAEALVCIGDSLYIFTKNWLDGRSNVYSMSKTPGTHVAKKIDSLNVQGFITSAAYDTVASSIVLTGYNILLQPFIIYFSQASFPLSQQVFYRYPVLSGASYSGQVEAISHAGNHQYYMSAEASLGKSATLFSVHINSGIGLLEAEAPKPVLFPNPADTEMHIHYEGWKYGIISNSRGQEVLQFIDTTIDVSQLPQGIYGIQLHSHSAPVFQGKIKIEH